MKEERDVGSEVDQGRTEQHIATVGGFAYGALEADVHVFGNGKPVYRLRAWSPSAERLEEAEYGDRVRDMARLEEWREISSRLSMLWLHGSHAEDRRRLTARFATGSVAAGWNVTAAVHGSATAEAWARIMEHADGRGGTRLLMIVERADRWPSSHLIWLFSNALLHRAGIPARVLLTAERLDPWLEIRGVLANHQASASAHRLEQPAAGEEPA
ncbi:hypothetical protein [Streptomyces zhihengii]